MSAPLDRETVLFNAARQLPAAERAAFLDQACASDPTLRRGVEELLLADQKAADFLPELGPDNPGAAGGPGPLSPAAKLGSATPLSEGPGDHIDRYKLLQQIGEGGCGVVYMAEQESPVRRRVALKVIKLGMDTRQVIARFEAEQQVLALMDHSHIAKVFDAGATATGRPYFVMELVKGIPITRFCDENELDAKTRLKVFAQVCRAIQHAHQKGIIHRDLKPSNILVSDHDGIPVPKIIDFGIAKATTNQPLINKTLFTAFEQFIGTPAYMSPEQARLSGIDVDTRSDIYSLGVLLYELMTGQTPVDSKALLRLGLEEMRRTICEQVPSPPSTCLTKMVVGELDAVARRRKSPPPKLIALLRGDLDWIVMKALEKDRSRRYETANGLALDVERYLAGEPVSARPPSKVYRFGKLVRRNRLAFGAALGIAITLAGGTLVSSWQAIRASRAERHALAAQRVAIDKSAAAEDQRRRAEELNRRLEMVSYLNEMNLALRYYRETNLSQALHLLEGYGRSYFAEEKFEPQLRGPTEARVDLRGFEWRYLYHLCRGNYALSLPSHNQAIGAMTFSPDGRYLATYCWDRLLRLWDLQSKTGPPVFTATNATGLGGFSTQGDQLVFGQLNGEIVAYELGTHDLTIQFTNGGELAAFAAGPGLVATFQPSSGLQVWDLGSRQLRTTLPGVRRRYLEYGWIDSVAMDPQGKVIATVEPEEGARGLTTDVGIHLWDPNSGRDLGVLKANRQIHALAFSPSGRYLAAGTGDGDVVLWDLVTHNSQSIGSHDKPVTALSFSPDEKELVTGSSDETIKRWEVASGLEKPNSWRGQAGPVTSLTFSPDGGLLAGGSRDSPIKVWPRDPEDAANEVHGLHSRDYANFAFSPDAKSMAAGCEDRTVKVWDVDTMNTTAVLTGMQYVVAFSSDSKHLLVSTPDPENLPYLWDLETKTGRALPAYLGNLNRVICFDFSPDRRLAALGLADGSIQLLDVNSGTQVCSLPGHSQRIRTLKFSADGETLVSGGSDHLVRIWDVKSRKLLQETREQHKGAICAATLSHDGTLLASGCGAGTIKLWKASDLSASLATVFCHKSALRSLDFSHDGITLASGGEDGVVKLWNVVALTKLPSQGEVARFEIGSRVQLVQFSPDDRALAVVTDTGILHLFRAVSLKDADKEIAAGQSPQRESGEPVMQVDSGLKAR